MMERGPAAGSLARASMAYVLAGGRGSRLKQLTARRAKPAVYFGGKSRIIDFALSNALNSGIRRIGVATQYKAHSLIRHLHNGWNFLRQERNEGFDILPASQRVPGENWYEGTADAVYQNIDIIEGYDPEFIVLVAGDHIYKMNYETMLREHRRPGELLICTPADLAPTARRAAGESAASGGAVVAVGGDGTINAVAGAAHAAGCPLGIVPHRRSMARVALPEGIDATRWPFLDGVDDGWYAKPDAGALIVSPADEDPVEPHDAWAEDMTLAEGIARYEEMVTAPVTRMLSNWAGLRSFAPDRTLVIGPDPAEPGFVWLAGQGGYGFQTCCAASRLAAALADRIDELWERGLPDPNFRRLHL